MIWIAITEEQARVLAEEEALMRKAYKDGKQGSILGQIFTDTHIMQVQFVPEVVAIEIINMLKAYSIYRQNQFEVSENPI